jgi:hypothetical protein
MTDQQKKEWIATMELVRDLYFHTGMNVSQVARLCRISAGKANNMIEGKLPKSLKNERRTRR